MPGNAGIQAHQAIAQPSQRNTECQWKQPGTLAPPQGRIRQAEHLRSIRLPAPNEPQHPKMDWINVGSPHSPSRRNDRRLLGRISSQ